MKRVITFEQAKAQYVHRYTMEHVPAHTRKPCEGNSMFYAPQYRTDKEWHDNTLFPGEGHVGKREKYCYSSNQSWPMVQWLDAPFKDCHDRPTSIYSPTCRHPGNPCVQRI